MLSYLLKRLALTGLVVVLVMTFLSVLVHLVPGDPVRQILGQRATPELVVTVREEMKLDAPVPEQVWSFLSGAVQGDLGRDFASRVPVTELIASALPHTIILALAALTLATLIGVPLGVFSAVRPNSFLDRITGVISISFITMPSYVAGLFLLLIFAVELNVLPATGAGELSDPVDYMRHLILPAAALAISWVGYLARLVRASMLEVMGSNYIRAHFAYGLRERLVFYRLGLKNAVIPVVAVLGVGLGGLMGGAVFVELIFARPGLGFLIVNSVQERNFTVVRGGVLVVALLFILANLLADLSYRFLDPRIRVEETPTI